MITYDSLVKPYSSFEGCGDFCVVVERSDSHLIVVGDVGGHGSYKVGRVANLITELVNNNSAADIDYIFKAIANAEYTKKYGVMLFVGRVDKQLPLLNYICVGDLKIKIYRQKTLISMKTQDGMVGAHLPHKINRCANKLQDADLLSITTDGVNRDIVNVLTKQPFSFSLSELNKRVMQQAGSVSDDSLSLLIKFKHSSANAQSKNQNAESFRTELVKDDLGETKNVLIKPSANLASQFKAPVKAIPNQKYLFCVLENDTSARDKIHSLLNFLNFPRELDLKLQTVILELIYQTQEGLQIFYDDGLLHIVFTGAEDLFLNCRSILGEQYLFKNDANDSYIICFNSPKKIDTQSEQFAQLKERIQIGLAPSTYKQYLKDKQRDETLAQQAKLASMGEMIGSIAHQWRQPLNELAIRIQSLKYQIKQAEDVDKLLADFSGDSLATIKFMSNTIDDFRNFFKVDKEKQIFSLLECIEQVKSMLTSQIKKDNVSISIEGADISVNSYKSEIQQVLLNLFSNAKDALKQSSSDSKQIKVLVKGNQIVIQDNGGGIPVNIEANIFEPYYTTKNHGEGTGIGLYMSKLIIENHLGGKLTFQNISMQDNQQGAQFTIHIPDEAISQ